MKKPFLFFCFLALIGCNNHNNSNQNTECFFVYVEAKTSQNFIGSGQFGDIILVDLVSREKKYLTNDQYFDIEPSISSDGSKLVFKSNRNYKDSRLDFIGAGSLTGIYIYDLPNEELIDITDLLFVHKPSIIRNFIWSENGIKFYYLENGRVIKSFEVRTGKVDSIYSFPSEFYTYEMLFIEELNSFVQIQSSKGKDERLLTKINLNGNKIVNLGIEGVLKLFGSWKNSVYYSISGKVYKYDLVEDTNTFLFDSDNENGIYIKEAIPMSRSKYLILGEANDRNLIGIFQPDSNQLDTIIVSAKEIEYLDLHSYKSSY